MRRKVLFLISFASSVACLPALSLFTMAGNTRAVHSAALLGVVVLSYTVMGYLSCGFKLTPRIISSVIFCFAFAVLMMDLSTRTVESEIMFPLLVLVLDMLLVMRVDTRFTVGFVVFVVCWLAVLQMERVLRLGLFDLPGLVPQEGDDGRRKLLAEYSACEFPPCKKHIGRAATDFCGSALVFLVDFIATRGFARAVLKEQASMSNTINTVQDIASLLAGYDVEKVAELLEEHEDDLPEGIITALRTLEGNLRGYKAYLPKTCLPLAADTESDSSDSSSSFRESVKSAPLFSTLTRLSDLGLSPAKATLLTINVKETARLLEESVEAFGQLFSALLTQTLDATSTRRGMVDVFIGDRIHCSFNTSLRCASHATSALHVSAMILRTVENHINIGVATGNVLRGDMGCDVMRRFSMIGSLVTDVNAMERAGRAFGCDVLCNRLCFSDTELEHDMRLVPFVFRVGRYGDEQIAAEFVPKDGSGSEPTEEEWMYAIGRNTWGNYNTAVQLYLKDGNVASALAAAGDKATELRTALAAVKERCLSTTVGFETAVLPVNI